MKLRPWLMLALAAGWIIAGAELYLGRHRPPEPQAILNSSPATQPKPLVRKPSNADQASVMRLAAAHIPSAESPAAKPARQERQTQSQQRSAEALSQLFANAPAPSNTPPLTDPVARVALAFVGTDPEAEDVWIAAINDPNTPAEERSNLIEDLNEDGFPDPDHVTVDDLPLIRNRLMLIEQLAPDAADDTNAAAFQEAYKDLSDMFEKASN